MDVIREREVKESIERQLSTEQKRRCKFFNFQFLYAFILLYSTHSIVSLIDIAKMITEALHAKANSCHSTQTHKYDI